MSVLIAFMFGLPIGGALLLGGFCIYCVLTQRHYTRKDDFMDNVKSESDSRIVNNTVRHNYRVLSDDAKAQMVKLKDTGLAFIELCRSLGSSRELSIAITNAEQAVMWAVKHITA